MKKMLLMLLVSLSLVAWRMEDYLRMAGLLPPDPVQQQQAAEALAAAAKVAPPKQLTVEELTRLSKTNPEAFKNYITNGAPVAPDQRGEVDKVMNLIKAGKYE